MLNLIQSYLHAGYTVDAPEQSKLQESYIQEEGEPNETSKEVLKYLEENEEKVEVEDESGKLQSNNIIVVNRVITMYTIIIYTYPEGYIQEEEDGEPSETLKEEVRKVLNQPQKTFREEQAEVEGGGGKLQNHSSFCHTKLGVQNCSTSSRNNIIIGKVN